MKKDDKQKFYTQEQVAENIAKSMYKACAKVFKSKGSRKTAEEVVQDVLDPNYVAEIDPDKIPTKKKTKVMWKSKCAKSKDKKEKGVKKLKDFIDNKKA